MNEIPLPSKNSDRIALRLRLLDDEREIQQREIEMEKRALALERKILSEKYRLLELQIQQKSILRSKKVIKSSTDDTPVAARRRAANSMPVQQRSLAQTERQYTLSIQPMCVEPSTNRLLPPTGTQQRTTSAFPRTGSKTQNLFVESNEWMNNHSVIPSAYVTPLSSKSSSPEDKSKHSAFGAESCVLVESIRSTTVKYQQLCRSIDIDNHRARGYISSRDQSSAVEVYRYHERRYTNTKDYRQPNKNKTKSYLDQKRIMITIPQQPHLRVETMENKPERYKFRATMNVMNVFGIHLDPDTGQELKSFRMDLYLLMKPIMKVDKLSCIYSNINFSNALRCNIGCNVSSDAYIGYQNSMQPLTMYARDINKEGVRKLEEAGFTIFSPNINALLVVLYSPTSTKSFLSVIMDVSVMDHICGIDELPELTSAKFRTEITCSGIGFLSSVSKGTHLVGEEQGRTFLSAKHWESRSRCRGRDRYVYLQRSRWKFYCRVRLTAQDRDLLGHVSSQDHGRLHDDSKENHRSIGILIGRASCHSKLVQLEKLKYTFRKHVASRQSLEKRCSIGEMIPQALVNGLANVVFTTKDGDFGIVYSLCSFELHQGWRHSQMLAEVLAEEMDDTSPLVEPPAGMDFDPSISTSVELVIFPPTVWKLWPSNMSGDVDGMDLEQEDARLEYNRILSMTNAAHFFKQYSPHEERVNSENRSLSYTES